MDRHEFVKSLIEKRDAARDKLGAINANITRAKARTKEAVMGWNGLAAADLACGVLSGSYSIWGASELKEAILPESLRVADADIIALSAEVANLEKDIVAAEEELKALRGRDFVAHLKSLIG